MVLVVLVQIYLGALVAGMDAGDDQCHSRARCESSEGGESLPWG